MFKHIGKKSFPYKYQVLQKFSLKKTSLIISIQIKNLDKSIFECGIGFHPWFFISKYSKIYSNSFLHVKNTKKEFKKNILTRKKFLDLNKVKLDETFLKWNGKSRLKLNKDIILNIINKKNVPNLHVYSPRKENFFCIEPVTNVRDSYFFKKHSNEYHGLTKLDKNKKFEAAVEFELIR